MHARKYVSVALVVLGLGGCGTDCLDLAQQYAREIPNALACDPSSSASQCGDSLPVVDIAISEQHMTVNGIGTCMHSANPARDGKLKQILSDYNSAGCPFTRAPLCPGVFDRCYVNNEGKGTCFE